VFCIGQRVLPAFAGMKLLFSERLMFVSTLLLGVGCFLRVASEAVAYQNYVPWAWKILPISAVTEMTAVSVFAINLLLSILRGGPETFEPEKISTLRP